MACARRGRAACADYRSASTAGCAVAEGEMLSNDGSSLLVCFAFVHDQILCAVVWSVHASDTLPCILLCVLRIQSELEQVQPEHCDGLHGHFPGVFTLQRRHAERMGLGLRVSPPRERRRPLGEPLRCPSGLAAIAHSSCSLWPKQAALAEESGCGAVGSVPSGLGAASRANPFRASEACASACGMRGVLVLISGQQTKIFTQPAFQPTCLSNMNQISTIHVAHNNPKTTLFC